MKLIKNSVGTVVAVLTVLVASCLVVTAQTQNDKAQEPAKSSAKMKFQPLNIKPGLWEQNLTIKVSGEAPVSPEMLSHMTPEQRARMEERMKANSAAHTRTTSDRHCLTEEELRKDEFLASGEDKECTPNITTSTSTTAKGTITCESAGMQMTGSLEIIAIDPEDVKGSWHATSNGGGHTMDVDSTFTSKWLGSSCGNVK